MRWIVRPGAPTMALHLQNSDRRSRRLPFQQATESVPDERMEGRARSRAAVLPDQARGPSRHRRLARVLPTPVATHLHRSPAMSRRALGLILLIAAAVLCYLA